MNRRTVLKGGFVLAATAHTAAFAPALSDPLLDAIRSYQAGIKEFIRRADEDDWDALTDQTYGPAQDRLTNWNQPASTRESAIAGLRLCLDADEGIKESKAADSMILAAIQYPEGLNI